MSLDVQALRAATPGCAHVAHFNHSGASLPSAATLAAVHAQVEAEGLRGAMEAGAAAAPRLEALRASTARLLNADPAEVAFTSSAAASWGAAFAALPPLSAGDRILVGRQEWGGNLATLQAAAARSGARIEVIPCDESGVVSVDALRELLDARVRLVALTWCPANGGLINPAARVGELCRAAEVPYFLDAGQALGQLPADVRELQCDVLTGAGRKYLRGPRGTAVLYVRRGFLPRLTPVWLDVLSAPWQGEGFQLRDDARRFETGELPVAALVGLSVAVSEALAADVAAIRARIKVLAGELRARLSRIPTVRMLDLGREHSSIVTFHVGGWPPEEVRGRLGAEGFNVAATARAYTPLDMTSRGLMSVVRASVHAFNSEDEIEQLARAVERLSTQAP